MHHALMEIHVKDGNMVCPSCGHIYVIKDGIPNMVSISFCFNFYLVLILSSAALD